MAKDPKASLPDRPKEALETYIADLQKNYYPWYERASRNNYYLWLIAQIVSVFAGFATAIIAALIDHLANVGLTFLRILLITLPIVGSFAATLLVQTRALERKALRERGRQAIQGLIAEAQADYAAAKVDADFTAVHQQLIKNVQDLEADQAIEFVRIAPEAFRLVVRQ
jgi:uncharacterized membrane protein YhaH (DUF805 family)